MVINFSLWLRRVVRDYTPLFKDAITTISFQLYSVEKHFNMWELFNTLIVFVCLLGTCFSWWSTEEQDYSSLNTRNNSKLIYIYIFICILYINFETHLKHCDTVCFGSSSHFYCKISRFWYYVASSLSDNIVNKIKDNSNTVQQRLQRIWSGYLLILHVLLCRFFVKAVLTFFPRIHLWKRICLQLWISSTNWHSIPQQTVLRHQDRLKGQDCFRICLQSHTPGKTPQYLF